MPDPVSQFQASPDWSRGRLMGGIAGATALLLITVGWLSGLRQTFHGVLVGIVLIGFLPFVIIAGGLLMALITAVAIGLAGGE